MKKNMGNTVVKKAISLAMALMVITLSPIVDVNAASATNDAIDSVTSQWDDAEKELAHTIHESLKSEVVTTEGPKKAIDDVYTVGKRESEDAMTSATKKAEDAAQEAEKAKNEAEKANESAQAYKKALDDYTNADAALVGNEGVYSIDYIPENKNNDINDPYNNCADIKVKVNGDETESLVKYTDEKKEIAKEAADTATEIAKNVTTNTNINEAAQKIADAKKAATDAVNDATKAYDSAVESLDAEIIIYNSYIVAYYSEEEAKGLLKKDSTGAYTTHPEIVSNLMTKDKMDEAFMKNLDAQKAAIDSAQKLVHDCETFTLTTAKDAIAQVEKADADFVNNLQGIIDQCSEALEGCDKLTPGTQEYIDLQNQLIAARNTLSSYLEQTKTNMQHIGDSSVSQKDYADTVINLINFTEDHINKYDAQDPELKDSLKNFFQTIQTGAQAVNVWYNSTSEEYGPHQSIEYSIGKANQLVEDLVGKAEVEYDGIIGEADKKVDDAKDKYIAALNLYNQYKDEYDKANLVEKFGTLKTKLDAAEADLLKAKSDFDAAVKDLKVVEDAKNEFDKIVSNISNSENGSSDNNSSIRFTTTSNNNDSSITTINDNTTPLSSTPDVIVADITDENVPLDSVPKTGDSLPASVPVACASFIAFICAALINIKKRIVK